MCTVRIRRQQRSPRRYVRQDHHCRGRRRLKPAPNHFDALDAALTQLNVPRERLLHVAQSLSHDHVPAKRHGLASVWINRRHGRPGWGATPEPDAEFSYPMEFPSMAAFAAAARESRSK